MKRLWIWLLCAILMLPFPASAEDFFTIDIDLLDMDSLNRDDYVARQLSASTQGVRVRKHISSSSELASSVRLTLVQMDSQLLLFDRDYGLQSGTFDSGVIYLPYVDDRTIPYLVTLYVGDYVYAMPFMHLQPRLSGNGACTSGVRLRDLDSSLGSDWLMGTMVDLDALRSSGSRRVDLCASNSYVIGYADLTLSGHSLCVNLAFNSSAAVEVSQYSLYVVTDCAAYAAGQQGPPYGIGEWIDVSGHETALIYLPMQVSYNPAGLPAFCYDRSSSEVQRQLQLWEDNCAGASQQESWQEEDRGDDSWTQDNWLDSGWDDGWADDGWTDDGWADDGWADGWDDSWSSDADGWADGGSW